MLTEEEKINYKKDFLVKLKAFAEGLAEKISHNKEWDIRGFLDIFKNVYTISADTKIISKILELHLFPYFMAFAEDNNYKIELPKEQNYYPDLTFVHKECPEIKFAVDLKSTYVVDDGNCNGFTLGSHGTYFKDRTSTKNITYPYGEYLGHIILGIIYSKGKLPEDIELKKYSVEEVEEIPPVAREFIFFAEEKWKIASDRDGSGNTANIGSIRCIKDILSGNGVFKKAGEFIFDDYWQNVGVLSIPWRLDKKGKPKKLSHFEDYLAYRGLSLELYNETKSKKIRHKSRKLIEAYLKKEQEKVEKSE